MIGRCNTMLAALVLRKTDLVAVRIYNTELQVAPRLVQKLSDSRYPRLEQLPSESGSVLDVDLDVPATRRTIPLE